MYAQLAHRSMDNDIEHYATKTDHGHHGWSTILILYSICSTVNYESEN